MNRINLDRLFRLLTLVMTVVVIVHIFSADLPQDRWPGGQLSRLWDFWKGSDDRDLDDRLRQRRAASSGATGEHEHAHEDQGRGASDPDPASEPDDALGASQGAGGWSGIQTLEDTWYLPRDRISSLSAKPIPMVFKGSCSAELRRAERAQDLATHLFPDLTRTSADDRALDTTEQVPQNPLLAKESHVVEATMFADIDGRYVQVKAVWNRNVPATYRVTAVSFLSSAPKDPPAAEMIDGLDPSVSYDILSVQRIFDTVSSRAGRSANLLQHVSRFTGDSEVSMRFMGPIPVSYEGNGEQCQLDLSGKRTGGNSYFECLCTLN